MRLSGKYIDRHGGREILADYHTIDGKHIQIIAGVFYDTGIIYWPGYGDGYRKRRFKKIGILVLVDGDERKFYSNDEIAQDEIPYFRNRLEQLVKNQFTSDEFLEELDVLIQNTFTPEDLGFEFE